MPIEESQRPSIRVELWDHNGIPWRVVEVESPPPLIIEVPVLAGPVAAQLDNPPIPPFTTPQFARRVFVRSDLLRVSGAVVYRERLPST